MMTIDTSDVLIIILSGNYSTGLGLVRSLGEAGFTVDLISAVRRKGSSIIASSSKYVRRSSEVFLTSDDSHNQQNILGAIREYSSDEHGIKILIPADDRMSYILDSNKEFLSDGFTVAGGITGGRESLKHLMDKAVQGKYASVFGLKRPEEKIIDLSSEDYDMEGIVYPCFIKPLKSIEGDKTEMASATDKDELTSCLDKLRREDSRRSVLVQRFLKVDKEYDIGGACLDDKVVIPGIIEKIRVAQYERGVTLAGRMVSCDILGDILDRITALMKHFHYTGLFDLELILSEGQLYLNEINFRCGGPNYAYTLNGANLPAILIKGMLGWKTDHDIPFTEGKTFVYEKVAWEEYKEGFMTRKELERTISEADFRLLHNSSDPEPGRIFDRRIRLSLIKHKLLKLIKR